MNVSRQDNIERSFTHDQEVIQIQQVWLLVMIVNTVVEVAHMEHQIVIIRLRAKQAQSQKILVELSQELVHI
jgi:hypothetical protein